MKKLIFMGILGLFALGACNNKNTQGHEGHGHSTVTHNNDEQGGDEHVVRSAICVEGRNGRVEARHTFAAAT